MAMAILADFAAVLVATLLTGGITYWIFKHFASTKVAAVAAFWLSLGRAGERYSFSGPLNAETAPALGALAGAVLALFLLWRWLLKRPTGAATRDVE